tara:strand:+ start:127 stop:399 length:273 start_codon:yes stop_codon:yes gene_type:complete
MTYNFNRSYDQRNNRLNELSNKQVTPSEGKYCVITTRDAYDGDFTSSSNDRHYFTNKRTAIAYAQHYSDICDHVAGVFKMPEFIGGISCR